MRGDDGWCRRGALRTTIKSDGPPDGLTLMPEAELAMSTNSGAPATRGRPVAIEIDRACKTYRTKRGGQVEALRDISLSVGNGEFLTIVGPSGCGKSTLLRAIAGLSTVSKGSIRVFGDEVQRPRTDVALVFQEGVLFGWRTVLENVMLPAEVLGMDAREARTRAQLLLEDVGLTGFESSYPRELSGGMQQRVAIARTLLHDPELLLMDEPFGAVDSLTREQLNLDLLRIWERLTKTVVLITHSIQEALFLADRVVVMSQRPGRITSLVEVPFGRPRALQLMSTAEFAEISGSIRATLGAAHA